MANLLGLDLGLDLNFGGVGGKILFFGIILLGLLVLGVIVFFLNRYFVYNKKVCLYENIAGRGYQLVGKDKARFVKLGDGGEEVLYLLKSKVYRTAYGSKMGKNEYWFAKGQDGYWYNFILGDLDAKMGMLDIEPIDRDMRYMHTAIRKNISQRYAKISFMDKYGSYLMGGIFIIIMMIGLYILLGKMGGIASSISGAVEAAQKVVEATSQNLAALDNIKSGGSGLVPVA